ncbi:MAG: MtrB/PioB family decaheme-associated outer membrane protein [Gammaproteobacteria bacterium]|nr:MtrB/PioB family decaheme-associated outer membrane protein [Gammaproteobacteria bacterium]
MNKRTSISLAVLAALDMLTLPVVAGAAPTTTELADEGGTVTEIGVGAGLLSDDSFRLGHFTGITEEGLFPELSFDVLTRSSYSDEAPYLWRIEGDNLGLDSQSLSITGGSQGRYSAFIYYREMPNLIQPEAGTPYRGVGSNTLVLPPEGTFATVGDHLHDVDIETKRQRVGLGGRLNITPRWRTSTALHHEHKEGTKIRGIGDHWGLQRATLVPAPVDYDTTRFEADLSYDGDVLQSRLGYMLSVFSQSDDDVLTVADAHVPDWSAAPLRRDALEPDNEFHQISANLGLSLGQYTRLGADVQVGVMQQDAGFVADDAVVTDSAGNVRGSLDGQIDTRVINLRASTRLFERLTLRADYRFDERDNKTPELVVDLGAPTFGPRIGFQCGIAAGVAANQCVTRPIGFEQRRASGAAEFHLAGRNFLTLAYTNDERERTYEDREKTEEETYEARLRSRWSGGMVMLNYAVAEQRGSNWERETLPVELRKYYLADRDRTRAGVHVSFMPSSQVQTTLRSEMVNDDYIASELGLTESERMIYSWDVAWFPSDRLQTYAFYSFETRAYDQAGLGDGLAWTAEREDEAFTVGLGGEYALVPKTLSLGVEGMIVQTVGKMDVIPAAGMSDAFRNLESRLGLLSVYGDWRVSRVMDVRVRYMMEKYDEKDWAVDGVGVTEVPDLILLARESPDYTAHLVAVTVRYRF